MNDNDDRAAGGKADVVPAATASRMRELGISLAFAAQMRAAARLGIVYGVTPVMKTDRRFLAVPQRFCVQAARGEMLRVATGPSSDVALIHIEDAVEGLLCLRDAPADVTAANVASEVRNVAEIASAVQRAAVSRGLDVTIEYDDGPPRAPSAHSVASALDTLGFKPSYSVEDGVGGVLDHYLKIEGSGSGEGR